MPSHESSWSWPSSTLQFVLTATPDALQIMDALLVCGEHPVERIAQDVLQLLVPSVGGRDQKGDPRHAELMAAFTPCFVRWMTSLIALLRCPEDYDSQPADRQDDFKKFRYAVADAVVDACRVIMADVCLERFWHALTELMGADECSWQGVEAVLYGVRSIARVCQQGRIGFPAADNADHPDIAGPPTSPVHNGADGWGHIGVAACPPTRLSFPYLVKLLESPDVMRRLCPSRMFARLAGATSPRRARRRA